MLQSKNGIVPEEEKGNFHGQLRRKIEQLQNSRIPNDQPNVASNRLIAEIFIDLADTETIVSQIFSISKALSSSH